LENLSREICTPWDYKQLAQACLSPADFLIWKAKYYDECDEQAQRNRDTVVPLTEDQLHGFGPFANALQQMQGMPQYFDQVRLYAKRAWSSLPDCGRKSTESFLQLKQKAIEPWAEFLACVKHTISCKYANAQRFLVCQIAYEGATKECKKAIRLIKNENLSTWASATQDIGTQYWHLKHYML
jgi:hypothetical protein